MKSVEVKLPALMKILANVTIPFLFSLKEIRRDRILIIDIYPDHCVGTFITVDIVRFEYTLFSSARFRSSVYDDHVVKAALDILGIVRIDFTIFLHYV